MRAEIAKRLAENDFKSKLPKPIEMSCIPGSPKTGGRKKGTPNKCRKSIDFFAEQAFKRIDMVAKGIELLNHKDPRVQAMVWCRLMDYKFGRPREQLVVSGNIDVRSIVAQARQRITNYKNTGQVIDSTVIGPNRQIMDSARSSAGEQITDSTSEQTAAGMLTDGEAMCPGANASDGEAL